MKYTCALVAALWIAATRMTALAEGTPKIQFDQTLYDFGKTSQVSTVSGVFKFKNVGDGILKVEPPKPSCGCTVAELKPDTLAPGATGELPFTLNMGPYRATLEKHISVRSNDPKTPEVALTIKVDYTPLYELTPMNLSPNLAYGVNETTQSATITRTDGKPLKISRIETTRPWIKAKLEPGTKPEDSKAAIKVIITREGAPRRFHEYVHVYGEGQTNGPISSLYMYGQITGEVSFTPESMYWSITDAIKNQPAASETYFTRRATIKSESGQKIEIKNLQTSVKGLKLELVTKEAGKVYELVARLEELPTSTVSGNISFETSVAAQPKVEVPITVNVFKQ